MKGYLRLSLLFLIIFYCASAAAQKVGLVLSGGGAKGLAHIGVIKALEENNVPIDYIMGTSMGGMVGGFYASGYSPSQMDSIARSNRFKEWVNGKFPKDFNTYYYESEPNPHWLEVQLGVDSSYEAKFKPQLANDLILNFALAEQTAAANGVAKANFDSLFVPFKVVGAEIFTQNSVYMDEGNLGASLRATMSVPFVYRPIKIDGKYLFDGGVYDNFPAEKMKEAFNPDFIIGVNVATKIFDEYPTNKADKLISSSLLYMMLDKVNPDDMGERGIFIEPNLGDNSGFEFSKAGAIIDSGYVAAMRVMPEILQQLEELADNERRNEKRQEFNKQKKPLNFEQIELVGFRKGQRNYVKKIINPEGGELGINELKRNYYKLIADPYFSNVFPRFEYLPVSQKYKFRLDTDGEEKIRLQLGGNVATSGLSNFYLGASFDHLNYVLFNHNAELQIGQFYKAFRYHTKINFPFNFRFYVEPFFTYNSWDYLNTGNFLDNRRVSPVNQFDRNYGFKFVTPFEQKWKLSFKSSILRKVNEYGNDNNFLTADTLDYSRFLGFHHALSLKYSSLNAKIFPTEGIQYNLSLSHNYGNNNYQPGSTAESVAASDLHNWFQFELGFQKYIPLKFGHFGFNINGQISTLAPFNNLRGTILNSPAYNPTFESSGLFLENFRAPAYLAAGLKYQIKLFNNFNLRTEAHIFKPFVQWEENDGSIEWSNLTPDYYLSGMATLFYKSPVGPIGISVHHYDDKTPFLALFNIGFLMFDRKPFE